MMASVLRYERVEPVEACVSPDGHDYVESLTYSSPIPDAIVCPRCGALWMIVVFSDGA